MIPAESLTDDNLFLLHMPCNTASVTRIKLRTIYHGDGPSGDDLYGGGTIVEMDGTLPGARVPNLRSRSVVNRQTPGNPTVAGTSIVKLVVLEVVRVLEGVAVAELRYVVM